MFSRKWKTSGMCVEVLPAIGELSCLLVFLGKTKAWLARAGFLCALVGVSREPILSLTCL